MFSTLILSLSHFLIFLCFDLFISMPCHLRNLRISYLSVSFLFLILFSFSFSTSVLHNKAHFLSVSLYQKAIPRSTIFFSEVLFSLFSTLKKPYRMDTGTFLEKRKCRKQTETRKKMRKYFSAFLRVQKIKIGTK